MTTSFASNSCLSIWMAASDAMPLDLPDDARVFEVGCAEEDWLGPIHALHPGWQLSGIDWRRCHERPCHVIRGDVLSMAPPDEPYDLIACISSLEHLGLGHYESDPLDPDGDMHLMALAARWLRPGGYLYADVPYNPDQYRVVADDYREYDDTALGRRLSAPGLRCAWRAYADLSGNLIPVPFPAKVQDGYERFQTYVASLWQREGHA